MEKKKLPIGYENFKDLRSNGFYFVDKSLLIKDLIEGTKVILFTRPRRFGKTLNMSMIRTFFEDERDKNGNKIDNSEYFKDLKIWKAGDKYLEHFGKYPVISLSLKDLKQYCFKQAIHELKNIASDEFHRHSYILKSDILTEKEKELYKDFMDCDASEEMYYSWILVLSKFLKRYHNQMEMMQWLML